ncbi:MAG: amino acid ABC transporter permease [Desulfosarcinaceae bacterium]|nr:amino acid ABC transporter permease [Desulfosarcinaceae bacterium]
MALTKARITPLDLLIGFLLVLAAAFVFHKIRVDLDYQWNWGAIPQYILRYDEASGRWVPNLILKGLLTTLRLSFWSMLLAALIGTVMGFARVSRSPFQRLLGQTYVETCRNLPPLVIVFIFYFFISDQLMPRLGLEEWARSLSPAAQHQLGLWVAAPQMLNAFVSAIISLAVFEGAYITEIIRAGIQSIDQGQWEASQALGMTRRERMRYVILPQALQRIIPPLAGQFISTIKDSAIVSIISIQELTFQAMDIMTTTYLTFEIWITVTLLYLLLTLTCSLLARRLELKLTR